MRRAYERVNLINTSSGYGLIDTEMGQECTRALVPCIYTDVSGAFVEEEKVFKDNK